MFNLFIMCWYMYMFIWYICTLHIPHTIYEYICPSLKINIFKVSSWLIKLGRQNEQDFCNSQYIVILMHYPVYACHVQSNSYALPCICMSRVVLLYYPVRPCICTLHIRNGHKSIYNLQYTEQLSYFRQILTSAFQWLKPRSQCILHTSCVDFWLLHLHI